MQSSTLIVIIMLLHLRTVAAWISRSSHNSRSICVGKTSSTSRRTYSSSAAVMKRSLVVLREFRLDGHGRRIRRSRGRNGESDNSGGGGGGGGWDDFDFDFERQPPVEHNKESSRRGRGRRQSSYDNNIDDDDWFNDYNNWSSDSGDGWSENDSHDASDRRDGFGEDPSSTSAPRRRDMPRRRSSSRGGDASRRGNASSSRREGRSFPRPGRSSYDNRNERGRFSYDSRNMRGGDKRRSSLPAHYENGAAIKINMKALEAAGFVHLYGLVSVVNALQAGRRDIVCSDMRNLDMDANVNEEIKPEAQFSPWLLVQEQKGGRNRSADKAAMAEQVLELAKENNIPVHTTDKGVLNTLSSNRPHQGYVLRCGKLLFKPMNRIPTRQDDPNAPSLWLVLDEVVDPQNLGGLIRSAYFLGSSTQNIGILVCAKNSAPPSPVVSAASAGALELVDIYSTNNLPRTLADAEQDGFRIVGASSYVPKDCDVELYDLQDLPGVDNNDDIPTILVLGSEGHGLRSLVARSCTEFVRIPGGGPDAVGVDSLNVSVTGGILLWHFLKDLSR